MSPLSMSMPAGFLVVFLPHISRHLQKCTRVGVVWDTYRNDSIKPATREKRGKGMRRKVSGGNNKVPGNWRDFVQAKLFGFLSQKSVTLDYPKDYLYI